MFKYHILFLICFSSYIHNAISYLIFPLEYLQNEKYKFNDNNNQKEPKDIMKQIYFRNLITTLEIGTPQKKVQLFIQTNSDKFYITSNNPSVNSNITESNFYQFSDNEYYDESSSSSYTKGKCNIDEYSFYPYNEICESNETLNLYINNTKSTTKEFPITLVRNLDDNIPGYMGLLHNDLELHTTNNLITRAKSKKLISNIFWFLEYDKINPLEKTLKGNLIIGAQPHEVYPNKYSYNDLESVSSYKSNFPARAWRLFINKIYVENGTENNIEIDERIVTLNYDIYNVITTMEFHNIIKTLFIDELLEEKKCFISSFTQNIYKDLNLSFYYCDKSTKEFLYKKMPNLKFKSNDLNFVFELTKEELFYEKDDYIYFMIIFSNESTNNWIMGQMFTLKYNFFYNNEIQQIGLYKKKSNGSNNGNLKKDDDKGGLSNGGIIAIVSVCEAVVFTLVGIIIGVKVFGEKKRKPRVNELENEPGVKYNPKEIDANKNNISHTKNEISPSGLNETENTIN